MLVREIMTRDLETISPSSSLHAAARMMRRRNIGFLPVVDGNDVVGVLTDRDIVIRGLCDGGILDSLPSAMR